MSLNLGISPCLYVVNFTVGNNRPEFMRSINSVDFQLVCPLGKPRTGTQLYLSSHLFELKLRSIIDVGSFINVKLIGLLRVTHY